MTWEEFVRRDARSRRGGPPRVTIRPNGVFALNKAAAELIGEPSHVVLLCDVENQIAAIRPSSNDVPHAYKLRRANGMRLVSGSAFCNFFDIQRGSLAQGQLAWLEDDCLMFPVDIEAQP